MAIANHDGIIHLLLLLTPPLLPDLPRRHRPPPAAAAAIPPNPNHLRPEADEAVQVEPPRELLQIPEHLVVAGEPARVAAAAGLRGGGGEGKVEEAHHLPRQVGAERGVEAGVGGAGGERVGGGGAASEPRAAHGGGALEHHGEWPSRRSSRAATRPAAPAPTTARRSDGDGIARRCVRDFASDFCCDLEGSGGVWYWSLSFCGGFTGQQIPVGLWLHWTGHEAA